MVHNLSKFFSACIRVKEQHNLRRGLFSLSFFFRQKLFFLFQLNYSTSSEEMVSEDDYEIWILPQKLQSVDINLQSFWSNWCSAEEECNTSCCDALCILFSTVSGHACHSPSARLCGYDLVTLGCESSETQYTETLKNSECQQKKMYNSTMNASKSVGKKTVTLVQLAQSWQARLQ